MRWSANTIAGFALKAGWREDDLTLATAIALAASDGWDEVWNEIDHTTHDRVIGLWQVPNWLVEAETASRLTNPVVNAQVAFRLWRDFDRSWDWSPTFQVGGWKLRIPEARLAATAPTNGEVIISPIMLIDTSPNRQSALGAIKELISQVNGFRRATGA